MTLRPYSPFTIDKVNQAFIDLEIMEHTIQACKNVQTFVLREGAKNTSRGGVVTLFI